MFVASDGDHFAHGQWVDSTYDPNNFNAVY